MRKARPPYPLADAHGKKKDTWKESHWGLEALLDRQQRSDEIIERPLVLPSVYGSRVGGRILCNNSGGEVVDCSCSAGFEWDHGCAELSNTGGITGSLGLVC